MTEDSPFYCTQQSRCLPPPHPKTEADPVSETLCYLAYRTMDEVKPEVTPSVHTIVRTI
jgi:hypothetical protein